MALCERCRAELESPLAYPPEIDADLRVVRATGAHIYPTTMDILGILWQRRGRTVSEDTLLRLVWGQNPPTAAAGVRTHIWQLRKVLKDTPYTIMTRHPRHNEGNTGGWRLEGATR